MSTDDTTGEYGPWNPGIVSELPRALMPLSTEFREENVSTTLAEALELSDFCGLAPHELVEFRPARLAMHEVLIRVTADLTVPDGPNYEDLGIGFRAIAAKVLSDYVAPREAAFRERHAKLKGDASTWIGRELAELRETSPGEEMAPFGARGLSRIFARRESPVRRPAAEPNPEGRLNRAMESWRSRSADAVSPFERACLDALIRIVSAIARKRGALVGDTTLIARLATTLVCNDHGSEMIGAAIEPDLREAAAHEGFRYLPRQDKPVVLNVKGASASGKSTLRPLQRDLADRLQIPWRDFALISPDIWRKFLLDYESLGADYKYAGTMTGHEVEIIDKKLDRYMANKAAAGDMSHLLIDRFRFDSFVPESDGDEASTLLTRFGDLVFMFFMITPPEATVERAWTRGLRFGRYKAVDDLLDHNIEAYTGMPQLFFTWALRTRKRVHYEFLDNSVPEGSRPRTVAFGWNRHMNILDIKSMLDIDRFRKIDVDARGPGDLYGDDAAAPENNTEFLRQCARMIPEISFIDRQSGELYARMKDNEWVWRDETYIERARTDPDVNAGLAAVGGRTDRAAAVRIDVAKLDPKVAYTVGEWGA